MTLKEKEKIDNMYYSFNTIKEKEKIEKNKIKEREKRIKENKKRQKDLFDIDDETVIGMTNKNNKQIKEKQNKNITKKQKQILKKQNRIKKIIKWTTLLIIIIAGIVFSLVSPIFNISTIEVINNNLVKTDEIISLSSLKIGQNIFRYNKSKVIKNIKENAYIQNIKIKRMIPNKIEISVQERNRDYNIQFLNQFAYINKQGYILEISEQKLELPTIKGIVTEEEKIKAGNRLNSEDLEKLETVIQIMNVCEDYGINQKITDIDISDKTNYIIYIEEELKTIYLGDKNNISTKILYIQGILEKTQGKEGDIFVNGDLNDNFKPRFKEKIM